MVSELHATGGGRLVAAYCVDGRGEPLMPCGRCRQLLWENGGADCLLMTPEGVLPMSEVPRAGLWAGESRPALTANGLPPRHPVEGANRGPGGIGPAICSLDRGGYAVGPPDGQTRD